MSRTTCPCWYFNYFILICTFSWSLLHFSTHLCFACHHFSCCVALFQGHVNLSVADPDLQIRRGGSHPDPGIWGGVSKNFFSASVWYKNKGAGPLCPLPWICNCFLLEFYPNRALTTRNLSMGVQWNLNTTKGPKDWQNMFALMRFRYTEVLFHILDYYWGKQIHSLYWVLCYTDVCYYEVPLYLELTDESNVAEKSLKLDSVCPKSKSGWLQFRSTLRMAWVAQALVMT